MVFADEIYDQILYDDAVHHSAAALAPDLVVLTFCGLSKTYRVAGFRSGWLVVSGPRQHARNYLEGLTMLASMRLCANAPASTPSRPRSGAASPSATSSLRAAGSTNSATWPGRSSTRSRACPA